MTNPVVQTLDLKAHRCPTAMIMARRAINNFYKGASNGNKLLIQTIEPSFKRDLAMYIGSECENLKLIKQVSGEIPENSKTAWLDDFDESDWENTNQTCYVLSYIDTALV